MRLFRLQLSRTHTVILVVMVFLSCVAAGVVAKMVPASYSTSAQLLLVGPTTGGDGRPTNPFLNFTPALNITSDVLVLSSLRPKTVEQVVADGGARGYQVADSTVSAAAEPVIKVTGIAPTPQQAVHTANLVLKSIEADLASKQSNETIQDNLLLKLVPLSEPTKPARQWKKAIELGTAALVIGLVVSFVTVVLLDRRRRRGSRSETGRRRSKGASQGETDGADVDAKRQNRPTPRVRPQPVQADPAKLQPRRADISRRTNGTTNGHARTPRDVARLSKDSK